MVQVARRRCSWEGIAYLQKHSDAGCLKYPTFRRLGLSLGSGEIESNIRRVVNLGLKGNAIYWREETAKETLQIRAQELSNRWDQRMAELRRSSPETAERVAWHDGSEGSGTLPRMRRSASRQPN